MNLETFTNTEVIAVDQVSLSVCRCTSPLPLLSVRF
jgi:hypothetical protein